jgi:phospholipid/cholesterol/gamma-HCH transport system substrate-binding protein
MITRRVRAQLLIFAVVTLLGVSYVGARYARLDRLLFDQSYTVVAHYPQSGGIFAGGEVTYRGVSIGTVDRLELTSEGVDVYLEIDNEWDDIPSDTVAMVGNRSAVGEQYVELQPNVSHGPYLEDGSEISDVETPIQTEKLLGDIATTVSGLDQHALRVTIKELGLAFGGTGEDLQRIIDTSSSFVQMANDNFDVTTALIRDANTVLQGQVDSASSLRTFARGLRAFSGRMAGADRHLRKVIDSGSFTANQLRTFLEQNEAEVVDLLNNVITTGRVVVANLAGLRQALIVYPVVLEQSFSATDNRSGTNLYAVHGGLILTTAAMCHQGYEGTDTRGPQDVEDRPLNLDASCTEPPTVSNPRGTQNLPRVAPRTRASAPSTSLLASVDPRTGSLVWDPSLSPRGVAPAPGDSWKRLYLEPLMQ